MKRSKEFCIIRRITRPEKSIRYHRDSWWSIRSRQGSLGESWAYPIQLFTQRGAFVLRPNYHGSNDYGLKWVESICCGKYYDLETPDINAGVDYLIAKGMGDPDRVATMGWSNGSILSTSLLITYPTATKWRASVPAT